MKRIKRVLLCRPNYFQVDYIINPLMKPFSVDPVLALEQWQNLVKTYESLGIQVDVIEQQPDVPDMVFATDCGIVTEGSILLANFRHTQRRPERQYYRQWFREHNFGLRALSNVHFFEGGDARFFGEKLFVGTGFRASRDSCEELAKKLNVEVVAIETTNPNFYHLDMGFLPLTDTASFYYPAAYSPDSQKVFRRHIEELFELTASAANDYAGNSVTSGTDIITQCKDPEFLKILKLLGYTVHQVDVSEFNKAGGGIRCLTNVLEWSEDGVATS